MIAILGASSLAILLLFTIAYNAFTGLVAMTLWEIAYVAVMFLCMEVKKK